MFLLHFKRKTSGQASSIHGQLLRRRDEDEDQKKYMLFVSSHGSEKQPHGREGALEKW